jgi:hypothetical protein
MMVLFLNYLSWNVLLRPLLWWHRELFFGCPMVGANVGGVWKFRWNPRTREEGKSIRSSTLMTWEETRNLLKTAQTSEVVNAFTRALAPPFIGRRRDFYIPKVPSEPRNIPSVNMYMNVFYISYIYKPATSSHTKPGLFETTSLTWLPTDSWISPSRKSSYVVTSELDLQQIPELRRFPISWFRRFMTPGLRKFTTSGLRRFKIPDLHKFATPSFTGLGLRIFASSQLRASQVQGFGSSQVQDS